MKLYLHLFCWFPHLHRFNKIVTLSDVSNLKSALLNIHVNNPTWYSGHFAYYSTISLIHNETEILLQKPSGWGSATLEIVNLSLYHTLA
jgi:hypothetical protein